MTKRHYYMKRKICIVTGSRAEYGILKPLINEIKNDSKLKLKLIVTGAHLSAEFGLTYKEIEADGFTIDEKIKISLNSDTPLAIARWMGLAMRRLGEAYERLKPDLVVLSGDRFEIFSAAIAAFVARIPIAHIGGGELTEGALDDAFRHAITKMSQLHFVSTEEYRKRVIQLGEAPVRVFNFGALSVDAIRQTDFVSRVALEKQLGFSFKRNNLLVTFHPATLEGGVWGRQFEILLGVLDTLKDTQIIFTKANADTGGRVINRMIDGYVSRHPDKSIGVASLGHRRYLSIMRIVDGIIGNSSSAIIEAPSFKRGAINIGDRQKGRIKAANVIDCAPIAKDIKRAITKLYSSRFQTGLKDIVNPYGSGHAASRVKRVLKSFDASGSLKKSFYNMDFKKGRWHHAAKRHIH